MSRSGMERSEYLRIVNEAALNRAREQEDKPPFEPSDEIEELRSRSYPMERGLDGYRQQLPGLDGYLGDDIRILDIGAGHGGPLEEIAANNGGEVVGTGITPNGSVSYPWIVSDALSLPFDQESFDLVLSVHGISWVPDQRAAILEAIRVTRPGGRVLLSLIAFSASVDIWYGEAFWDSIRIDPTMQREFDYSPDWVFPGCETYVSVIDVPEKRYRVKYYVEIEPIAPEQRPRRDAPADKHEAEAKVTTNDGD